MALPFWFKKACSRLGVARYLPAAKRYTDGEPAFVNYYSDRVLAAPIDELLDPVTFPRSEASPDAVNLNLPAPRSESAVSKSRVIADRLGTPSTLGLHELRKAIADLARMRDGRTFDPAEQVLITHGATAAYANVLDAFVNPGDSVVLFDPSSPLFSIGAKSRRAKLKWVPSWNENGRSRFLIDTLARRPRGSMLFVVANPSNVTGGILGSEEWEQIAWAAERHDTLVYVDESFGRYRYDEEPSSIPISPTFEKRLMVAGSVTQTYGLGSARVGWLTGPRQLVRAARLTATLSAPFIPTACQSLAIQAMQATEDSFRPTLDSFRRRRQYAFDRLRGLGMEAVWPSGAYFLWVPVRGLGFTGRQFAERLMKEEKVLVGTGDVYGPSGMDSIRISYAADEGRLREGLTRLGSFVKRLKGIEEVANEEVTEQSEAIEAGTAAFSRA